MSSIEKRADDSYRVKYRVKGKQRSFTCISVETAELWKARLDTLGPEATLAMMREQPSDWRSVGEFLESHIVRLTGVTDGTKVDYRAYIRRYMDDLVTIPVAMLKRETVSKWVNRLADSGLSAKTIANVHGFLSAAMNTAIEDELLTKNPCKGMRLPRTDHESTEMIFLSRGEFEELYALVPAHYQPFILTLVGTGMRFGEATALTVGDVDLKNGSIRIKQSWKKTGLSQKELGPTKTKRSNRTVAIPPQVSHALAPLVHDRPAKEFLFLNLRGKPISGAFGPRTWTVVVQEFASDEIRIDHDSGHRKVRVVTKQGDGKHPRIHDLRHTFASWAISSGVPLPVIQRQLGHESITTTVDRYGHLARADFDALASSTANFLPDYLAIEG